MTVIRRINRQTARQSKTPEYLYYTQCIHTGSHDNNKKQQ